MYRYTVQELRAEVKSAIKLTDAAFVLAPKLRYHFGMNLEDYFDFFGEDDIRIKGTRVGVETVLYDYVHRRQTPEEIAARYPAVTLEQVYATVLYYLHNRAKMDAYLADWLEWGHRMRQEQRQAQSELVEHLVALREERATYSTGRE